MQYSLKQLRKKTVINVLDAKKLGRICDVEFTFPENCVKSFTVAPPFSLFSSEIVLSPCDIERIGEDAVLVRLKKPRAEGKADSEPRYDEE